ncbi:MAG TPA: alpha-amylase family glycosyl hydrolase [Gaiellaceae bacterium]|nr:alpha-amylase family glycosyl hydrolase [Gaiellaceae bacterium]
MARVALAAALAALLLLLVPSALGSHTAAPASVGIAGNFQWALGCPDWNPPCPATQLAHQGNGVWRGEWTVPTGTWQYKAALNGGWDESYAGTHRADGNTSLVVPATRTVRFYYDHKTHAVMDSVMDRIPVAVGSFQDELGCGGDWAEACLRTLMTDADGDGTYEFSTASLPAGSYEAKVALGESWDENYGGGSGPFGNHAFTVGAGARVTFSFVSATNSFSVAVAGGERRPARDGDVWWDGLGHDSRDTLYRAPGGAVPAGDRVLLRFRTYHDDVEAVTLRTWHTGLGAERLVAMKRVATDVSCYAELAYGCDFWQAELETGPLGTIYYRFVARDGGSTAYYEDEDDVRDGGWGAASASSADRGWVLTVHDPAFRPVPWMRDGVVYQIFPDRFRNGNPANDPAKGRFDAVLRSTDARYAYPNGDVAGGSTPALDQILRLPWGASPEGGCRAWAVADGECAPRFGWAHAGREGPRGRDYYGGDLEGVIQKLPYLKQLGVTVLYFNPIFDAGSNHRYDTRDYRRVDPYLGSAQDWRKLERQARALGMRIILDGVFNHMSSDSPLFDRYRNWPGAGACESEASEWRHWFRFRQPAGAQPAACAPYTRDGASYYDSWFGFDSLPQLSEHADVRAMVHGADDSIARRWLRDGAAGWRLDVMQDKSAAFWAEFRERVKDVDPEAIIVGELWKKFDVLPFVHGDTADTTMNYRFRDAVLGLLSPQAYDSKGFPGGGVQLAPSTVVERLESVREDYPDAAYLTQMNLLDSHDTERALWTLTPGAARPADREANAANVAEGKRRLVAATLLQMAMPGAPTIYYGNEVGLTGADDPDNRRTYPWADGTATRAGDARRPDAALLAEFRELAAMRAAHPVLARGELTFLLADDAAGTLAFGRKAGDDAALVAVNASREARTVAIPVSGYVPDGTQFERIGGSGTAAATASAGTVAVELPPLAGVVLASRGADLTGPAAPAALTAAADGLSVSLSWAGVEGATGYDLYRSPVSGGGYVRLNAAPLAATSFVDTSGLRSGQRYHYVVRALDEHGNASEASTEAAAVPSHPIGWANLQWPPELVYTVSAVSRTDTVYGQVWIDGVTAAAGATPGLAAQLGFGTVGSDPRGWSTWEAMSFNVDAGNNDEFMGTLQPTEPGSYDYVVRYSTDGGASWTYADLWGPFTGLPPRPGRLTVHPPGDTTAPAAPTGLTATNGGPTTVLLAWEPVADVDLHRYDVYRATAAGGPYVLAGSAPAGTPTFADGDRATGTRYWYVVRAVDTSNNASGPSNEASAVPERREVAVTLEVAVPAHTPAGAVVHVAGNVPELCAWCDPHTVALARGADGKWRRTMTFLEGATLEFKYTLGSWTYVEKDAACQELGNRQVHVAGDASGAQLVTDAVANWRNVAPCGN